MNYELGILRLSGVFTWQPKFCQVKNTWQAQREFGIRNWAYCACQVFSPDSHSFVRWKTPDKRKASIAKFLRL